MCATKIENESLLIAVVAYTSFDIAIRPMPGGNHDMFLRDGRMESKL